MAKDEPRFVLTLKLKTEPWQEDIVDKRIEAGRKLYNALVNKSLKVLRELEKTKQYRSLMKELKYDKSEHDKEIWIKINDLREKAGLSKYGLQGMMTPLRYHFKNLVNTHIAIAIANRVWDAYVRYFYKDGEEIHFKKFGSVESLEGKNNKNAIMYKLDKNMCVWGGLNFPVVVDEKNFYEMEALAMEIAYCRIIRKYIRGKRKYYLQIVFKGLRPAKRRKSDGKFTQKLGKGDVGIDIGTSTVAYVSENEIVLKELADKAQGYERERLLLRRKLDRSRRATNPNNYNEDGTCKKGAKHWVRSNHYMKILFKLKDIYRKQKVLRRYQHELLTNHLLTLGDTFYVEDMDFKALAKKAKEAKKNKKGKNLSRKRFGKSIANRAPAMFLEILDRKLHYFGKELMKINTREAKASQYNHVTGEYKKKGRNERWNDIEGNKVQRDLYSAFLIMNVNKDLSSFNLEKCNERYNNFLVLHNKEIERLIFIKESGKKLLSSMGI